jgi:hypothetical protein
MNILQYRYLNTEILRTKGKRQKAKGRRGKQKAEVGSKRQKAKSRSGKQKAESKRQKWGDFSVCVVWGCSVGVRRRWWRLLTA